MISIIIGLVFCEFLSEKIVTSNYYWSAFVSDGKLGWRFKPNSSVEVEWYKEVKQKITGNEYGYRDSANPKDLNTQSTVISLQGDSNIMGYGIYSDDLVSNVLKEQLRQRSEKKQYEVINAGVSGYDLQNYINQFDQLKINYRPAYNFVFFNMENDHLNSFLVTPYNLPRPYHDLVEGQLIYKIPKYRVKKQVYPLMMIPSMEHANDHLQNYYFGAWKTGYVDGLASRSYLAYLIGSRLGSNSILSSYFGFHNKPKEVSDEGFSKGYIFAELSRFRNKWDPIFEHGQKMIEKLLHKYRDFKGTNTVVILLPERKDIVDRDKLNKDFQKYLKNEKPDPSVFYERMKKTIKKSGLNFINLRPIFLNHTQPENLYLVGNNHISPEGHRVIAQVIVDYLLSRE